jgi:hypothetical protein
MKFLGGRENRIEAIVSAYIDSKSNRAIGEKAIGKSNYAGQIGDAPFPTSV